MCDDCTTGEDARCSKCDCTDTTQRATFVGGTRYQAGGVMATDCARCGHEMHCPDTSPKAASRPSPKADAEPDPPEDWEPA